ncbi:hypothetical protein VTN77DRAFT_8269 [Rasamsonia byssochlamydoides]|uniref:uncharacterized protein n=1 Tax=Rasamsonia byssochlamydoides TaxID=89139 RepID=UPI003741EC27
MASDPLPANVHISTHPCLRAKLSQLRSQSTTSRETRVLVHDIATILGCEALASGLLKTVSSGTDKTPLDIDYTTETIEPSNIALIPVLRSGLGMIEALQTLLPFSVPIHHLGLFRERTALQAVEYFNRLPYLPVPPSPSTTGTGTVLTTAAVNKAAAKLAILLDPVIATGGNVVAAIKMLREWGVQRVLLLSVLGWRA